MTQRSKRPGQNSQLVIPGFKPFPRQGYTFADNGGATNVNETGVDTTYQLHSSSLALGTNSD